MRVWHERVVAGSVISELRAVVVARISLSLRYNN